MTSLRRLSITISVGAFLLVLAPAVAFAQSGTTTFRVNAGGGAYTDSSGAAWSADCCNSGGNVSTSSANVAGTADPQLYRTLRWSTSSFTYTFSGLAAGTYQVTLKFAEISGMGPGRRQFNVAINGSQVLTNFDVAAQVGFNKALDKTFTATVGSTNQLTVTFARGAANNPMVSAIQVVQTAPAPPPPTPTSSVVRVNAGGGAYTDSSGAAWSADCCNSGGSVSSTSANVAGTADPQLYRTLRWSTSPFTYTFSGLAAGTYQVTLKFAEISGMGPGRRQFNVAINGSQVLTNFDVAAQVGLNTALDKTLTATVGSTGQLTVTFARGAADNPMVSAIQVVQTGPPPTTTTTTSTVDPSGQTMPAGDVPGWHQVFADDFSNENVPLGSFSGCSETGTPLTSHCTGLPAAVDSKWWAYPDGWAGTPATAVNYPSKVLSIQNGVMNYAIHTETINGSSVHAVAAPLPKIPGASGSWGGQLYGRYVFRARMDPLYGYHASFLLWPDSNVWPRDGEIDWPEADLDSPTISGFMHWQNATAGAQQDAYNVMDPFDQWHTYEIDWTSTNVSFYIDGNLVGNSTDPTKVPDTPMHLVLQIGASVSETAAPTTAGNVQIDWLTVYRPA